MKSARLVAAISLALAMLLIPAIGALAQDATPDADGTPAAECVAPELPPGAPSEPDASPVAEDGMPMEEEAAAPVAEGPASRDIAAEGEAALANFVNCINAGDWEGAAALMTPHMVTFVTGGTNPYDVVAALAEDGPAPLVIVDVRNPIIDTNNRIGLSIVFSGFFNEPGIQIAEKWYFVRDGDTIKLDDIVSTTIPEDLYPDATLVTIEMVDYAFALDTNTIPAGPVIFRFTNTSFTGAPHVSATVTLTEDISSEEIIEGETLPEDKVASFVNAIFLEPGQTADYYVEDLAPGTYNMVCDVTTEDGTPHWQLGMVAKFTVE